MQVGFTVVSQPDSVEVHLSVPDNNDQCTLVTHARADNSFACLIGHLYYQRDIISELPVLPPYGALHECQRNDAALALTLYRSLGMAALERLEGDFALVIWDAEHMQLIGLRDPLGGYPLFWTQYKTTVALSTSIQPLRKIVPHSPLNETYFADFIMMQAALNETDTEQCAYGNIYRVLPGTMITTKAGTKHIDLHPYWDWLKHVKDPGTNDLAEIAEQYRWLLRAAVRERIRGCTLAHLSGGMDSTSIALLARDAICTGAGEAPLHTASLVYDHLPLLAQERPYIESALRDQPAIVAHRIQADEMLDYDVFTDPPIHDEPHTALASFTARMPFATLATNIGARTILTGYGSDEVHYLLPYHLADLLRQPLWEMLVGGSKIWKEAARWAKVYSYSPWRILTIFGIDPIITQWVAGTRWANLLIKREADWSIPPWILPDFARRHALRSRAIENSRHIYQQCQHVNLSVTLNAITSRAGDAFRWSVTAPLGIDHAHPFLDPRLLSFSLGMQSRILPDPGNMKPVLAEAMRGILPDMIRCRQHKGGFNETYYLGLARNRHHLESLIQQAPLEGMIDKHLLIQHLREGSLAVVPVRHLQHLNHILALLKWLCMQDNWHDPEGTSTEVFNVPIEQTTSKS